MCYSTANFPRLRALLVHEDHSLRFPRSDFTHERFFGRFRQHQEERRHRHTQADQQRQASQRRQSSRR